MEQRKLSKSQEMRELNLTCLPAIRPKFMICGPPIMEKKAAPLSSTNGVLSLMTTPARLCSRTNQCPMHLRHRDPKFSILLLYRVFFSK